ncbi:uncharacterized protein EAF01_009149 [Botrytis porri]|uniref:Uncharacterized protein n=1 Tax=Botrytis porri TaxID=87229 RepID=A0A4Z1KTC0_9HELO|nr:uncharacterized protein EAF01_009149 [Botrytis porri]KAF7896746.1 hypothetical protein EAF01_009149 [Botrytis porri]TGO87255.1 hypothetical protein BPOR_0238g00070 [Botrytis porri]
MGKLAGLISSGIGLAMEAKTSYQSPSPKSHTKDINRGSSYTGPSQMPLRTLSKGNQHSNDEDAYQDLQAYADYQNTLSDRISADIGRDENYRKYLTANPRAQPMRNAYERDVSFYSHELPEQRIQPARGLSCPVILPQRRPEAQSRGIIRAYSLELAGCGIDQDTFLDFIDDFNEAHKASPYLDAVNVAAQGVGFAPGISPMIVSMVVPIAVRAAKGYQTQRQSSSFLDRANANLFVPHGLFAMVLTFRPDQTQNLNEVPGEVQLPLSASLIYPEDERRAQQTGLKKMGHFIADYGDRRAQARYAHNNPESSLTSPLPTFNSRWADPNHPANSGGLKSLLTGVPDDRKSRREDKKDRKRDRRDRRRRDSSSSDTSRRGGLLSTALGAVGDASGRNGSSSRGRTSLVGTARGMINGPGKQDQSLIKGIRGIGMKTDILYLMITNNPEDQRSFPSSRSQTPLTHVSSFSPLQSQTTNSNNRLKSSKNDQDPIYSISNQDRMAPYTNQNQNNNPYIARQDQVATGSTTRHFEQNDAPPPAYREAMPARYYDQMRQHDEEFCAPTI